MSKKWVLSKQSLPDDWEKEFDTEAEVVAELRNHVCGDCMLGRHGYVASVGLAYEYVTPPDPNSRADLLKTPCGCEFAVEPPDEMR